MVGLSGLGASGSTMTSVYSLSEAPWKLTEGACAACECKIQIADAWVSSDKSFYACDVQHSAGTPMFLNVGVLPQLKSG